MNKISKISKSLRATVTPADEEDKICLHSKLRSKLKLPDELPAEYSLSIASTRKDFELAFRIVHDSYTEEGLMRPHRSGMRITKYHALPTTTVLIAKLGDEAVGTATIIQDSPLGLPIDEICDVNRFRRSGNHLAEISSLAIAKTSRGRAEILLPIVRYCFNYCYTFAGIDNMISVVNPGHQAFYEGLLFFQEIENGKLRSA